MTSFMRFTSLAALILFFATFSAPDPANAFRSTKQESFTDPDYFGYQPKVVTVLVLAQNLEVRNVIEKRLTEELTKRGITVYSHYRLFPPTRDWDGAQRAKIYEKFNIDSGIVVAVGASSHEISQIGSQTWSSATATAYGNTASASGTSTTVPIVSARSSCAFGGALTNG